MKFNQYLIILTVMLSGMTLFFTGVSFGQDQVVKRKDIEEIVTYLASDEMKGRRNGSSQINEAATFIRDRFKRSGVQTLPYTPGYFLPFLLNPTIRRADSDILEWNGKKIKSTNFIYLNNFAGIYPERTLNDFELLKLETALYDSLLFSLPPGDKPLLVWTTKKFSRDNSLPDKMEIPLTGVNRDLLFVVNSEEPMKLSLKARQSVHENIGYNVVGMLPGKTKPKEVIVFSAHYDHVGLAQYGAERIMNGANDNASGTAALIRLAEYFSLKNDNERTIIFCAFAGEELGMLGSFDFMNYIIPSTIIANINMDMLGIPQFGRNSLLISGTYRSELHSILKEGFAEAGFTVKNDEGLEQLFERSDNFPFYEKKIPAHTIMSCDDKVECYHMACDETPIIDFDYLTRLIDAIAIATRKLVSGERTPARIK